MASEGVLEFCKFVDMVAEYSDGESMFRILSQIGH
jgi:hypothetical protein